MSQYHAIFTVTARASGAVQEKRFVDHSGAQAGANANALGVSGASAADGELLPVHVLGTAIVETGGAVNVGDPVSSDAQGRAVVTDGTTYTVKVGRAREAASAAGEFIEVLLIPS